MRALFKSVLCATVAFSLSSCVLAGTERSTAIVPPDPGTVPGKQVARTASFASTAKKPSYTFIAAPDFLNQDVGDVSSLPGWDPGEPNSWTVPLQASIDVFLDEIRDQDPDSVVVTGDLVEGHWLEDVEDTGIFGPMRTEQERSDVIRRAGDFYHSQWLQRFDDRGLVVHAAVGDHDIGDNAWSGSSEFQRFKREHVGVFKDVFGEHYTREPDGTPRYTSRPVGTPWEDTAYAVQLSPDLLLVTLDVFHVTQDDVVAEVVGGQMTWLRDVLKQAQARGTKWIVVQGHTPISTPVRTRSSSGLSIRNGTASALWATMARFGVDVYLSGEVHDTTMTQSNGITQISTGGLLYKGESSYMTVKVYGDRLDFDVREFDKTRSSAGKMWQFGAWRTSGGTTMHPGSHSVGTLTLWPDHTTANTTGKLVEYHR